MSPSTAPMPMWRTAKTEFRSSISPTRSHRVHHRRWALGARRPPCDGSVTVSGTPTPYAYVAAGKGGIVVLDAATASAPVLVGTPVIITDATKAIASANDVVVSGNYAYVAAGSAGLVIFDVSTPSSPVKRGHSPPGTLPRGWPFRLGRLCGGGFGRRADRGRQQPDKSLPARGVLNAGLCVACGGSSSGAVTYAYVADGSAGLQVMDVSDSTTPSSVAAVDTPSLARGVSVSGADGIRRGQCGRAAGD